MSISEWLDAIHHNHEDMAWFRHHRDEIKAVLRRAMAHQRYRQQGADALLLIYRWVYDLRDLSDWQHLLADALLIAQEEQNKLLQAGVWHMLGTSHAYDAQLARASQAFDIACTYAQENQLFILGIRNFIARCYLHRLLPDDQVAPERINKMLSMAEENGGLGLRVELHDALHIAMLHRGELRQAEHHACEALPYWEDYRNILRLGYNYYHQAISWRSAGELERANDTLERARYYLARTPDPAQHALIAYETAVQHRRRGDLDDARVWYKISRNEMHHLKMYMRLYLRASVDLGLGATYAAEEKFHIARPYYQSATLMWKRLQSPFNLALTYHAYCRLEKRVGDLSSARRKWQRAWNIVAQLPDSPRVQRLRERLHQCSNT